MSEVKHWHFESLSEMVKFISHEMKTKPAIGTSRHNGDRLHGKDRSFYGKTSFSEICELLVTGGSVDTSEAMNLLNEIMDVEVETLGLVNKRDVVGNRVSIGEYMAGSPTCFRRKARVENENAPVRVFFSLESSASINPEQFKQRGLAILALTLKLQMVRPVELIAFHSGYCQGKNGMITVKINTLPLDLATFLPLICDTAASRRLLHGLLDTEGWKGNGMGYDGKVGEINKILGVSESDIHIGFYMGGQEFKKPIEWVNGQLEDFKAKNGVED